MTRRLLLLSCSARKRNDQNHLSAIDRYDGPLWRVVRGYMRDYPLLATDLDVFVLSAVYGLIPATQDIPWYEQKMTPAQAKALQPSVIAAFRTLMQDDYGQLCLALSHLYMQAMQEWETIVVPDIAVTHANGPIGTKQAQVQAWLHNMLWQPPADRPVRTVAPEHPPGSATLCNMRITMSRDEVLNTARQQMARDSAGARRYRDWYVLVDGQRVAPKWLVSQISGIPTSRFDAGRARAVLLALGIDVERVT